MLLIFAAEDGPAGYCTEGTIEGDISSWYKYVDTVVANVRMIHLNWSLLENMYLS